MLEVLGRQTPNAILGNRRLETLKPRDELIEKAKVNIPVAGIESGEVIGTGDWDSSRSEYGSVVIGLENQVVKIPLGRLKRDPQVWVENHKGYLGKFNGISPNTHVFLSKVDSDEPKPVIIQDRVCGRQACESTFRELMTSQCLSDLRKIVGRVKDIYNEDGIFDLCGQRLTKTAESEFIHRIPFFADNIMVTEDGRAVLVDNTPFNYNENQPSKTKRLLNVAAFQLVELGLLTLEKISGLWPSRSEHSDQKSGSEAFWKKLVLLK